MKKIIVLLSLLASACSYNHDGINTSYSVLPKPALLRHIPQGADSFSSGFRHGCYSALGHSGYGLVRIYDKTPDINEFANKIYTVGYKEGDTYCGTFVNQGTVL
jgi:hypothetical protein